MANFTFICTDLTCAFDASTSYDPDGSITSYAWAFGDENSGSGATASHIYTADGTYTVFLTVTDNQGAPGSTSKSVTVASGGGGGETVIYVFDITMSGKKAGTNRSAIAVVTIVDAAGNPVSGATVAGAWSGATSGSVSGTTDTNGTVSFESAKVRKAGTFTFTVTNVTKTGAIYDASQNVETSDSITVQ